MKQRFVREKIYPQEEMKLRGNYDDIIGKSEAMMQVLQREQKGLTNQIKSAR